MNFVKVPKILLPKNIDMSKWATIACDQFTARQKYWDELESYVGDSPSTLRLVFPEIYLSRGEDDQRIEDINNEMKRYFQNNLFQEIDNFILVEREVECGKKRMGLMIAIDLEGYDWHRVRVPFRATEHTLTERLPVRIKVRQNAILESPHAIALIDNPEKNIIEPIYEKRHEFKKLYDFDLNMNGGNIKGYEVPNSEEYIPMIEGLLDKDVQINKYGLDAGVLMVIGDGNHSVATAKKTWDGYKENLTEKERETHPLRYMLIELINVYSGVDFHPIHRIVYNPPPDFHRSFKKAIKGNSSIKIFVGNKEKIVSAPENVSIAIMEIQEFLENLLIENPSVEVDYVHNEDYLKEAVLEKGGDTVGIVMPNYPGEELVNFVVNVGNLPKKAFSIGEPEHKRYYLEMRKITP